MFAVVSFMHQMKKSAPNFQNLVGNLRMYFPVPEAKVLDQ